MNKIKIQTDIIHNNFVKNDIILMHIADIHFSMSMKISFLDRIKNEIIKNNPDYLLITGDLVDDPQITKNKYKIKELIQFLVDISRITKVIISLGNHDVHLDSDFSFFKKLNDFNNIFVLDNDFYKDDFIYVSGITLPVNYYYNMTKDESLEILLEHIDNHQNIVDKLPSRLPKILLIHSPIKINNKEVLNKLSNFDLILCGHTHNGMVPDFLAKMFKSNEGIIAPNKKLLPETARGKIEKMVKNKKITIIITGGITKLSLKSSKVLNKLNFIYNISINKIILTKKRGISYE